MELPKGLTRSQIRDARVLDALGKVPRERFIPEEYRGEWREDRALPIGAGQTISQPFIVALMTQQLKIERGMRVLEIGTGSGYQAAVLAELGAEVFSVEIVPELQRRAEQVLEELGYTVHCRLGDGWDGWKEEGPFDAIIVTACCPTMPKELISQLKPGGRMVFPIKAAAINEGPDNEEELQLLKRHQDDTGYDLEPLGAVRFVPITRAQ